MIEEHDKTFPCARGSGKEFFVKTLKSESETNLDIVFLHDLFDYHKTYINFGRLLAENGYNVHLPDFRGFGLSAGARGVIDRHDDLVDDIENYLKSLPHRVILGGLGFGALVAIRLLHRQSLPHDKALKGLILCNPLLRLKQGLPDSGRFIFERLKNPFDLVPLPWRLGIQDRCANESASVDAAEDPLVRDQLLLRSFREVEKLVKLEQNASYLIDVPTLTLLPGSDTISSISYARLFTKAIDPDLSVVKVYERTKRDMINDTGLDDAPKDVIQWLKNQF